MRDSLWDPFLVVPMYVLLPPHGMHLHLLIGTDLDRNFGERDGRDRRERDSAHVQCATMVVRSVASIGRRHAGIRQLLPCSIVPERER